MQPLVAVVTSPPTVVMSPGAPSSIETVEVSAALADSGVAADAVTFRPLERPTNNAGGAVGAQRASPVGDLG